MSIIIAQATPAAPAAAPAPAAAAPAAPEVKTGTVQSTESAPAKKEEESGGQWNMIISLLLIGVIFYFIVIRPQTKQQKELKQRQEGLKTGDKVITNAGLHGIVREIQDRTVKLELAPNMVVKIEKSCIVSQVDKNGNTETVKK